MLFSKLQALAGFFALIDASTVFPQAHPASLRRSSGSTTTTSSLWVSEVPDSPRPYAVRHYGIDGLAIGAQIYRFPVTGPSSDNAFSLFSTAAPASGYLGVLPHTHQTHYENFFTLKGRIQLWTAGATDYANEEARLLTAGDFGAVPHNTTHTFQIQDPDTDIVGIVQPGGFEVLFDVLADANHTASTYSPYALTDANAYDAESSSPDASVIASLQSFDVWGELNYTPSRDLINGSYSSSGAATGWHTGNHTDELSADSKTPYFVAKDYGVKYLSDEAGFYQIVQPLVTPTQSAGNFTIATIIVSEKLSNETAMSVVGNDTATSACASGSKALTGHSAFQIIEGMFTFEMSGETIHMVTGDVVFIPAGTAFSYYSLVPFTKVLLISQGADGLDTRLIENGQSGWEYPTWPAYA